MGTFLAKQKSSDLESHESECSFAQQFLPEIYFLYNDEKLMNFIRELTSIFINIDLSDQTKEQKITVYVLEIIELELFKSGGMINKVTTFDKGLTYIIFFGVLTNSNTSKENQYSNAVDFSKRVFKRIEKDLKCLNEISIGIASGKCFVGIVGHYRRAEFTAMGIITNSMNFFRLVLLINCF